MAIAQTQLTNAKVAIFFDPDFVDVGNDPGDEASNLQQVLVGAGHTVSTFTGTSTEAWRAAILGVDVLVIPELQDPLTLTPGAIYFVKDFISRGGTLIFHSDSDTGQNNVDLVNTVFGLTLQEIETVPADPDSTPTANVAGTTFAGGAATLPGYVNTDPLTAPSLPSFAESYYEDAAGNSTVAAFQYGKGQVIWLSWDWSNAAPAPGVNDGGWNDILARAISLTDLKPNGLVINGTKKDDKVKVDPTAKSFDSSERDDVMKLKAGNDKAWGGGGHDAISGDKGKDKLHGGDNADILNGGKDKDKLWGDAGGDYFLFDQSGKKHADQIKDFVDGEDMLVLKASKFDGLTPGDMSALQFSNLIEYQADGWLKFDGQKFAKLQAGGLAIDQTDFIVI